MRVQFRQLRRGEVDHEAIWLLVSVAAGVMAAVWLALQLPWPRCTFRALTGVPCLTCGTTRSFLAFLHGDFFEAWRLNPLVFAGLCGVALFDLYALATIVSGAPRLRFDAPRSRRMAIGLLLGIGALNWLYLLIKG